MNPQFVCGYNLTLIDNLPVPFNSMHYMIYYNSYNERDDARELSRQIPDNIRSAIASRDYSRAERICPNGIKIGRAMREAVSLLA